jgi:hypothetical protein
LQRGSPVQWLRPALSTPALPDGYAARVYALSPDNLAWLETLGVGTHLQHGRIGSVQAMEIRGPQGGLLELSARQTGVPQMAVIVESDNLQLAVDAAIAAAGGDDRLGAAASAQITAIDAGDSGMAVSLNDGVRLNTPLLVAADGANSPLRALAGIDTVGDSYHHRAVVANFECERPHRGIACQWFNHGEVLAWLPLPDRHISMVWSVPDSRAETLLGLDDVDLLDMMAARINPAKAAPWPRGGCAGDTTWIGAADRDGCVVSMIQSIYFEFGSGVVLPRTGLLWQNRGTSFRLAADGWNALAPGRLPFHTLNPSMALFDDGRVMAFGTMGGEGQPHTQAALFTRYARNGMSLADSVAAPRWLLGRTWGDETTALRVESRLDAKVVDGLRDAGHAVKMVEDYSDLMGHAGAIVRHGDGALDGASDPRADGGVAWT